jgi:hypothetical protein
MDTDSFADWDRFQASGGGSTALVPGFDLPRDVEIAVLEIREQA